MAKKPTWGPPLIRLAVSVEGQTEEEFVKSVLSPHLLAQKIYAVPILLGRARVGRVGGGNVSQERLVSDMAHLYRSFDAVTSLVDFYGFKGKGNVSVEQLEKQLLDELQKRVGVNKSGVIPYVQRHEFEGLLFSNVSALLEIVDVPLEVAEKLSAIRERFQSPEDINDNRATAPSRRILDLVPNYRKRLHGPLIAEETGLEEIRAQCPRFNAWVRLLETLKQRIGE